MSSGNPLCQFQMPMVFRKLRLHQVRLSSLEGLSWNGGGMVTGKGFQHSLGISYTCGFFCLAGMPKFVFYPPYLALTQDGVPTPGPKYDGIVSAHEHGAVERRYAAHPYRGV
jgi:hypothetical protein